MEIKAYDIVSRAVEEGVRVGYIRAYKYTDSPSEETIRDQLYDGVMLALDEIITWQPEVMLNESKECEKIKDVLDMSTNFSECDSVGNQGTRGRLQEARRAIQVTIWTLLLSFFGIPLIHFVYWYWVNFVVMGGK